MEKRKTMVCCACKVEQPSEKFNNRNAPRAGWIDSTGQRKQSMCKVCQRWDKIARRYGLSREGYLSLREKQNCRCAICNRHEKDCPKKRLHVDHNHHTGAVRSLLCQHCNHALGNCFEDVELLQKMIDYLHSHDNPEPSPK